MPKLYVEFRCQKVVEPADGPKCTYSMRYNMSRSLPAPMQMFSGFCGSPWSILVISYSLVSSTHDIAMNITLVMNILQSLE